MHSRRGRRKVADEVQASGTAQGQVQQRGQARQADCHSIAQLHGGGAPGGDGCC